MYGLFSLACFVDVAISVYLLTSFTDVALVLFKIYVLSGRGVR